MEVDPLAEELEACALLSQLYEHDIKELQQRSRELQKTGPFASANASASADTHSSRMGAPTAASAVTYLREENRALLQAVVKLQAERDEARREAAALKRTTVALPSNGTEEERAAAATAAASGGSLSLLKSAARQAASAAHADSPGTAKEEELRRCVLEAYRELGRSQKELMSAQRKEPNVQRQTTRQAYLQTLADQIGPPPRDRIWKDEWPELAKEITMEIAKEVHLVVTCKSLGSDGGSRDTTPALRSTRSWT